MTQALTAADVLAHFKSDEALAAAARETREDFGALYERHMPRVYRNLVARTSSRDEAADLTQLVFVRALDSLPNYRPAERRS